MAAPRRVPIRSYAWSDTPREVSVVVENGRDGGGGWEEVGDVDVSFTADSARVVLVDARDGVE